MPIKSIQERAKELRDIDNNLELLNMNKDAERRKQVLSHKLQEFEIGFKDIVPMLQDCGVHYSAHYNNVLYDYQGFYIEFNYKGHSLRMDFSNRHSYRYEHIPNGRGSMVYGDWSKDKFILWIDENLLSKADKDGQEPSEEPQPISSLDIAKSEILRNENYYSSYIHLHDFFLGGLFNGDGLKLYKMGKGSNQTYKAVCERKKGVIYQGLGETPSKAVFNLIQVIFNNLDKFKELFRLDETGNKYHAGQVIALGDSHVRIMHVCEGYVMARRKGAVPFVKSMANFETFINKNLIRVIKIKERDNS